MVKVGPQVFQEHTRCQSEVQVQSFLWHAVVTEISGSSRKPPKKPERSLRQGDVYKLHQTGSLSGTLHFAESPQQPSPALLDHFHCPVLGLLVIFNPPGPTELVPPLGDLKVLCGSTLLLLIRSGS
jgi:hypothetical protein